MEKKEEIEKVLQSGTIIIMDRYYQSNLVYGLSHDLDLNWLINLDKGLPQENLVIILEIDPETSCRRVSYNRDVFERNQDFLVTVKQNYRKLSEVYRWNIINGEENVEKIHNRICNLVRKIKYFILMITYLFVLKKINKAFDTIFRDCMQMQSISPTEM